MRPAACAVLLCAFVGGCHQNRPDPSARRPVAATQAVTRARPADAAAGTPKDVLESFRAAVVAGDAAKAETLLLAADAAEATRARAVVRLYVAYERLKQVTDEKLGAGSSEELQVGGVGGPREVAEAPVRLEGDVATVAWGPLTDPAAEGAPPGLRVVRTKDGWRIPVSNWNDAAVDDEAELVFFRVAAEAAEGIGDDIRAGRIGGTGAIRNALLDRTMGPLLGEGRAADRAPAVAAAADPAAPATRPAAQAHAAPASGPATPASRPAGAASTRPATAPANDPAAVLRAFAEHLAAGDVDAAAALWHVEHTPHRRWADAETREMAARHRLREALARRIDPAAAHKLRPADTPVPSAADAVEVDVTGDNAVARWRDGGGEEQQFRFVRVKGRWRLSLETLANKVYAAPEGEAAANIYRLLPVIRANAKAADRVAAEVEAGKLKTIEEANRAEEKYSDELLERE